MSCTARLGFFRTSDSQTLITFQPRFFSASVERLSRSMLVAIFLVQYEGLGPRLKRTRFFDQFRPCQKSPSQKIASRNRLTTMSGLPGRLRTFFRKRNPEFQSALRNSFSALVSDDLMRASALLAFVDDGLKCLKLTELVTIVFVYCRQRALVNKRCN
jgi:hypothetical protein